MEEYFFQLRIGRSLLNLKAPRRMRYAYPTYNRPKDQVRNLRRSSEQSASDNGREAATETDTSKTIFKRYHPHKTNTNHKNQTKYSYVGRAALIQSSTDPKIRYGNHVGRHKRNASYNGRKPAAETDTLQTVAKG